MVRQDGPFEKKVRDAKATVRDGNIRDFLCLGPTDAMRKLRFDMYKSDANVKTQQPEHQA